MLVGFGSACITPEESVPLAGMGNTSKRMSTTILDDLYATCVAFTDEANRTVLLFTLDQLHANKEWTDPLRQDPSGWAGWGKFTAVRSGTSEKSRYFAMPLWKFPAHSL